MIRGAQPHSSAQQRAGGSIAARLAGLAPLTLLAGCSLPEDGLFGAAGPVAEIQRDHLLQTTLLVLVVIVPLYVLLPLVLWRYRLSKRATYRPDWKFAWKYELPIWGIPVIIVAILAVSLWQTVHRVDPYHRLRPDRSDPIEVQVVGLDWKFLFIYPQEGVASVNELVVPAGREIAFTITADGPMMSFMVPRLGSQIYAMAGMETQLHLIADKQGDFNGLNTQYNGKHFDDQKFVLRARDEAGYRAWLQQARKAPALDQARYAELARPSTLAHPLLFGGTAPGLFDGIVGKYHNGGGMTAPGHGGHPG